jgi:hypothetical protein
VLLVLGGPREEELRLDGLSLDEFQGFWNLPECSLIDDLAVAPIDEEGLHLLSLN